MRRIALILAGMAALFGGCSTGGTKMTSSWRDPQLRQPLSGPVMVLARLPEPGARRAVEDASVAELAKRGVRAVAAYHAVPQMGMEDPAVLSKAEAAGMNGVMVYTVEGSYTGIANRPGVGAGVGIGPVGVGVGPVIGGPRAEQRLALDAQLFPVRSVQPVWSANYDINLKHGLSKGMADVPGRAVAQARADGAI